MLCFWKYGPLSFCYLVMFFASSLWVNTHLVIWFVQEHKYFEDAFKVYERGVKIFKYPHVKDIWVTYLSKFVKRYGKSKLERARELFEHAVEVVCTFYSLSVHCHILLCCSNFLTWQMISNLYVMRCLILFESASDCVIYVEALEDCMNKMPNLRLYAYFNNILVGFEVLICHSFLMALSLCLAWIWNKKLMFA